jgi:lipid-A-disaccharide synthase
VELFVSAGEASSDIHCAHLIEELKRIIAAERPGETITTFGLGGDKLAAGGTELFLHNRELSVMGGPMELLSKIPLRRRLELRLERELFAGRVPKGAILVDNGEINLRLASLLHFFNVPVVYFIPPKVWVWRHSRIEKIEQHVDLVLSILPFEEPIYRHWEIPFKYVGNPLIDEVDTSVTMEEAKRRLGIDPAQTVLTVFVGSRHSEVKHHTELFGEAIRKFLGALAPGEPRPLIVLPAAPAIEIELLEREFGAEVKDTGCGVKVVKGMSHECLKAARAALVKSGTSTLEAALLGTPMVLSYRSSASSEWAYKHLVRYRGFVGLVNLFLAENAEAALGWEAPIKPTVPELILDSCSSENIAAELQKIYMQGPERERMLAALARTRQALLPVDSRESSPLKMAAKASWELFRV